MSMWLTMVSLTALAGVVYGGGVSTPVACEEARLKCAYRVGCGKALNHYLMGCSAVLQGPHATQCPEACQHSLIALTSTEEGKEMMECECSDEYCKDAKSRVEICRHPVTLANRKDSVVSCRVAQWICAADALCSKALEYYNEYCKSMFQGRKCSHRCLNSISILRRQEKAAKLTTCRCDGREDYDCEGIQENMARLCYRKKHHQKEEQTSSTTTTTVATVVVKETDIVAAAAGAGVGSGGDWALLTVVAAAILVT